METLTYIGMKTQCQAPRKDRLVNLSFCRGQKLDSNEYLIIPRCCHQRSKNEYEVKKWMLSLN